MFRLIYLKNYERTSLYNPKLTNLQEDRHGFTAIDIQEQFNIISHPT